MYEPTPLQNKPDAGWRIGIAVWLIGGSFGAALRQAFGDGPAGVMFLALVAVTILYLGSRRCRAMVNRLLDRWNLI